MSTDSDITSTVLILSACVVLLMKIVSISSCTAPFFDEARRDLLVSLSDIPGLDIAGLDAQSLCHLILFGNPDLTLIANRMIMEATIDYIKATKRLD